MSDKATNGTENLVQAYNRAVESAVGAFDAGVAQSTVNTRLLTDAAETERREFANIVEQGTALARRRGENLAAVLPEMFQAFAVKPGGTAPEFSPEARESISKLIESETEFYQSLTQAWMQYITGSEQRRSATTSALLEGNAKMLEASQNAARGAAEYGEAIFNWSMETATARNDRSQ